MLQSLDIRELWTAATSTEKRILAQELIETIWVHSDRIEVKVAGAPKLQVLPEEVGLKPALPFRGVGERTRTSTS